MPRQVRLDLKICYLNLLYNRDEARATAASSALSRILQGAVKLPCKASQGTQNDLQSRGGNVEYLNQDMLGEQLAGEIKLQRKVWKQEEEGTSLKVPAAVGERVVGKESSRGNMLGQGSRESKGADEVEVMAKPRESLFSSSKQGGGDGAAGIVVKSEGEVGSEDLLPHGIQGMEDFSKWSSPKWNRMEDFGSRDVDEFARGFHNLGI